MVSFQEAQEIVLAQARSFGTEDILLDGAFGRVLAEPIRADRDYPPFPRATMDGYALRYADLERGVRRFRVVETVFAGMEAAARIGSGECYKIMTGAAVPQDADMVIRREDVKEGERADVEKGERADVEKGEREGMKEGEMVMEVGMKDPEPWRPYLNIARQGEDIKAGEVVIEKPCRCDPAVMGLLATLGRSTVTVARGPQIGLITTGNEVVKPGDAISPVQIRNSNLWMLLGALRGEHLGLRWYTHVGDDRGQVMRTIERFLDLDVLIVTGGVSAGDADHVPQVLGELGVRQLFHKIAMRPGKPTWCGVSPRGGMVFALPGNPFSCLVNFALLIAPYLHACLGLGRAAPISLPLREARKKRTTLDEFFPVRMEGAPAMLSQLPLNGSGDIRLGMQANALALHPAGSGDLAAGAEAAFYSFV
ncbi:MAG TPA: molybdopterin molybdotransferase MoeA [Puia sp.]|nr:molybdopterin molybdotransferase MoeA [Puia sp.]